MVPSRVRSALPRSRARTRAAGLLRAAPACAALLCASVLPARAQTAAPTPPAPPPPAAAAPAASPTVDGLPAVTAPEPGDGDALAPARAALAQARRARKAGDEPATEAAFRRALDFAKERGGGLELVAAAEGAGLSALRQGRPRDAVEPLKLAAERSLAVGDQAGWQRAAEQLRKLGVEPPTLQAPAPKKPPVIVAQAAPARPPPPRPAAPKPAAPAPRPRPSHEDDDDEDAKKDDDVKWEARKPTRKFGTKVGVDALQIVPRALPGLAVPFEKQYGGSFSLRSPIDENWLLWMGLGATNGGLVYDFGLELRQTVDLYLAYLTFGIGAGFDGITGGAIDEKKYGLPFAWTAPARVTLVLGRILGANLYGEAKAAWVATEIGHILHNLDEPDERQGSTGIALLDKAHFHEASLEVGLRFSNGLELAGRRAIKNGADFNVFVVRYSGL